MLGFQRRDLKVCLRHQDMEPKVVVESRELHGSGDDVLLQRVATIYVGRDEYRVYAPPKATGDALEWFAQWHVCQYDGTGEIEVQGTHRVFLVKATRDVLETHQKPTEKKGLSMSDPIDRRKVFVVYGRNSKAHDAVFSFLQSIDLAPMEWEEVLATAKDPSPYVGDALERGFSNAQAAVVVLTGDDMARCGTRYVNAHDPVEERVLTPQPRPNVLFEAGMALGKYPERTVLVSLGPYRKFSDIDGRHILHLSNKPESRLAFADRLRRAGCAAKTENRTSWLTAGDFDAAMEDADLTGGNGRPVLKMFKREFKFEPDATFKRKIWIEFQNVSDQCLALRYPRWVRVPDGIHATTRAGTFQLQLGNTWCPEKIGAQQINLPPGDLCRLWAEPDDGLSDEEIKKICRSNGPLGAVAISVNGEEISIPV
jgi:predicted nucleotide-binding protein